MNLVHDLEAGIQSEYDYHDAVAYFRAAVRQNPTSLLYLNDLGVTEMRVVCQICRYNMFFVCSPD